MEKLPVLSNHAVRKASGWWGFQSEPNLKTETISRLETDHRYVYPGLMGSSLRAKIMSGVVALLFLFAGALGVTLYLIRDSSMELMGIEQYHLALNKMTSISKV